MDEIEELSALLIPSTYAKQGVQSLKTRHNSVKLLLTQKKLPIDGWNDNTIEYAISQFSAMDSNNFNSNVGVGEREGRLYSDMVSKRHYALSHGIGRSGDIAEVQPKAAGSSIIYKLANSMSLHALQLSGLSSIKHCLILPLATGMTMTMTMLSLRKTRPNAKYVIWSRIDQKSCFKAIITAGLIPLILENILVEGDKIETNIIELKRLIEEYGSDSILCVLTTTSCFAPRQPDRIDVVRKK
jgi:O-phospho-L-seryl-tRNASec:L-selenocysteinyl-tRNA synthase